MSNHWIVSITYILVCLLLLRSFALPSLSRRSTLWAYAAILVGATVVRLIIAPTTSGLSFDFASFSGWSERAFSVGFGQFYNTTGFVDYPPGYIYVLYVLSALRHFFNLRFDSGAYYLLMKLPAIICDIAAVVLIIKAFARNKRDDYGVAVATMYAFCPAVIINSAIWAQVDSVLALFAVYTLVLLYEKKYTLAGVVFALAALIKPQALFFAPVVLLCCLSAPRPIITCVKTFFAWLATFAALALPFTQNANFVPLFNLYVSTMSSYPYASVSAYNIYILTGGMWVSIFEKFLWVPYNIWGNVALAGAIAIFAYLFIKTKNTAKIFYLSYLILLMIFVTSVKMHERYLFPALILLCFSFITTRDKRFVYMFVISAITVYLNEAAVLYIYGANVHWTTLMPLGVVVALANVALMVYSLRVAFSLCDVEELPIAPAIAGAKGASAQWYSKTPYTPGEFSQGNDNKDGQRGAYSGNDNGGTHGGSGRNSNGYDNGSEYVGAYGGTSGKGKKGAPLPRIPGIRGMISRLYLNFPKYEELRLLRADWIAMAVLTILYAAVAFSNLGDMRAPQTYWKAEAVGENITLDLGAVQNVARINTYTGVMFGKYDLATSVDKQAWIPLKELDTKEVFKWNHTAIDRDFRYLKITAKDTQEALVEVALFDRAGRQKNFVVSDTGHKSGAHPPQNIADEQRLVVSVPTYLNGTYFDEIYHARTAFEHITLMNPYEITHPPLGKLIISIGLAIFGMNPFGWRFMGTLFGVLMVPLIYLFIRRMSKRTDVAVGGTLLLCVDFMHFVQTRISTIDVYSVFWVMLMYYFMYIYATKIAGGEPFRKTLLPLGLSGLFFGIGAASKWTCIYAGGGLAVILLITFVLQYAAHLRERHALKYGGAVGERNDAKGSATVDERKSAKDGVALSKPNDLKHEWAVGARHDAKNGGILGERDALGSGETLNESSQFFPKLGKTILWCVLFFIIVPAIIYVLSYIPSMIGDHRGFDYIIDNQKYMFNYHSTLKDDHAFASKWYTWILDIRPIWYYMQDELLGKSVVSSIASFGNPAVWWGGAAAIISTALIGWRKRCGIALFIVFGYLAQLVPWMAVSRVVFIYHYFACTIFMIMATAYCVQHLLETNKKAKKYIYAYYTVAVLLFVMFYPVLSGLPAPRWYYDMFLRWLPSWGFYI